VRTIERAVLPPVARRQFVDFPAFGTGTDFESELPHSVNNDGAKYGIQSGGFLREADKLSIL
jgi:hypothetical protein